MIKTKTKKLLDKKGFLCGIWVIMSPLLGVMLSSPLNICYSPNFTLGLSILYIILYSLITYNLILNFFIPLLDIWFEAIITTLIGLILGLITIIIIKTVSTYIGIIAKIIWRCG